MSDVPDDVMEQAEDYYESVLDRVAGDTEPMPVGGWRGEYIRTFARAILAEREACARIAEGLVREAGNDEEAGSSDWLCRVNVNSVSNHIAKAIRRR